MALSLGMVPSQPLRAYVPHGYLYAYNDTHWRADGHTHWRADGHTHSHRNVNTNINPDASSHGHTMPTGTPLPTLAPTATPWILSVTDVGPDGLRARYTPDGPVMGELPEGSSVVVLEEPVTVGGEIWYHIISPETRLEGWVVGEYLAPGAP